MLFRMFFFGPFLKIGRKCLGFLFRKWPHMSEELHWLLVDPVVVLTATVWGVTRGSDAVSGQLERGTLEMILAQPVRRRALYNNASICYYLRRLLSLHDLVRIRFHTAIQFGPWSGRVNPLHFLPAALNVFGLMVCMSGLAGMCVSM